jgi:hypothetical protein
MNAGVRRRLRENNSVAASNSAAKTNNTLLEHTKILASNFHDEIWRTRSILPSIDIAALLANTEYCVDAALRINAAGRASVANLPSQDPELQRKLALHAVNAIADSWKQNPNVIKSKHIMKIAKTRLKLRNLESLCPPVNPPVPMKAKTDNPAIKAAFDHPYLCPPIPIEAPQWADSMPGLVDEAEESPMFDLADLEPQERASWNNARSPAEMERSLPKISQKTNVVAFVQTNKVDLDESNVFDAEFEMATPVKIERSASPELVPLTPMKQKVATPLVPLTPVKTKVANLVPLSPVKLEAETPELEPLQAKPPSCEVSLGWLQNLAAKNLVTVTSQSTFLALSDNQLKQFSVWASGKDASVVEKCQQRLVESRLSTQNLRGKRKIEVSTLGGTMHRIENGKIVGKTQTSELFPFERKINGHVILVLASDHPAERN